LDGKCDDLPEGAFFMVGDVEDARKKAEGMHYIALLGFLKHFVNINIIVFFSHYKGIGRSIKNINIIKEILVLTLGSFFTKKNIYLLNVKGHLFVILFILF
jgi:hypothetical protein